VNQVGKKRERQSKEKEQGETGRGMNIRETVDVVR
jgi:hypothetical protein